MSTSLTADRHVALLGAIPHDSETGVPQFGGLTKAALTRSMFIAQELGVDVEVITFDHTDHLETIRGHLVNQGLLTAPGATHKVTLVNMHEELAKYRHKEWRALKGHFDPEVGRAWGLKADLAQKWETRDLHASSGKDRRTGDLIVRTTQDPNNIVIVTPTDKKKEKVLVQTERIYGRSTRFSPLRFRGGFFGGWGLRRAWLTQYLGGAGSVHAFVDGKPLGELLTHIRIPGVAATYVVHGDHKGGNPKRGFLAQSRAYTLSRSEEFDGLNFLTGSQSGDFSAMFPSRDATRYHVVPHVVSHTTADQSIVRDPLLGITMSRLDKGKRIEHAMDAVRRSKNATLEVFGNSADDEDGREYAKKLAELIEPPRIEMKGRSSAAAEQFARASFVLVTSKSESFCLTIVEAMAAGCIPISYDARWGPIDLITDGVDGILVAGPGSESQIDVAAATRRLTNAIDRVTSMSDLEIETMRDAARKRAADFTADAVALKMRTMIEASLLNSVGRPAAQPGHRELFASEKAALRMFHKPDERKDPAQPVHPALPSAA